MDSEDVTGVRCVLSYEIRIHKDRHRTSLVLIAECRNDVVAIILAQKFLRKGEGGEVWRGDTLVYRLEPRTARQFGRGIRPTKPLISAFHPQKWLQHLANVFAIRSPSTAPIKQ